MQRPLLAVVRCGELVCEGLQNITEEEEEEKRRRKRRKRSKGSSDRASTYGNAETQSEEKKKKKSPHPKTVQATQIYRFQHLQFAAPRRVEDL